MHSFSETSDDLIITNRLLNLRALEGLEGKGSILTIYIYIYINAIVK